MPKTNYAPVSIAFAAVGFLAGALPALAQLLPADRATTWNPGIPGGVPARTTVCATLSPPSGDAASAIQSAINACPAGQVVQLSSGTFTINSGIIFLNKGVTLRGAGANLTTLKRTNGAQPGTYIPGSAPDPVVILGPSRWHSTGTSFNLAADGAKGATSVQLATAPASFTAGQIVLLDELSGSVWQTDPGGRGQVWASPDWRVVYQRHNPGQGTDDPWPDAAGWFARQDRPQNEVKEVASWNASTKTLTFTSPLHISYRASHTAQIYVYAAPDTHTRSAGLEDVKVQGGGDGNIRLENCAYCWVARIEGTGWLGEGVALNGSYRSELRDSYIHTPVWFEPGGGSYNISIGNGSAELLIENNISVDADKVMVARSAGSGSVVAYNYMDDGHIGSSPSWQEIGLNASHMVGAHHVLFEGNYGFNFDSDKTHGSSTYMTVFRNHLSGKRKNFADGGPKRTAGAAMYSYFMSYIGNVLGLPGMSGWQYESGSMDTPAIYLFGWDDWSPYPVDPKVKQTALREGNFDYVTNTVKWDTTAQTLPNSLYLTSKPAFFGNNTWPWVDPLGSTKTFVLPAKQRFEGGGSPAPSLSLRDATVTEGNSGTTTANFTVTLSPAATTAVTVNYATANGNATAGSDYVAASGTLTFSAGQTSKTIPVTVNGDTLGEPDEAFVVNLSNPSGAVIQDAQGVGTIVNDDVVPNLSINDVTVAEGNSGTTSATFTLTLSAASTSPVSVTYATSNGTATAGTDYAATGGTVTFPAGSTTQTLTVTVTGDATVEPNETFFVNLSGASGASIIRAQGVGTITNDDSAAQPTLSIADVSVTEGNSATKTASFTVTLSAAATSTVTVGFSTANGTAAAGADYVAQSGTLTLSAGQTTKTIAVVVNGDTTVEPNETFTVTLASPSGATLSRATATGTITNDDTAPLPTLSVADASVTEGNSGTTAANFVVTLSAAATSTVTVAYSTANGTATAGSDFVTQSGTLTFSAGQTTKTIGVLVNGDTTVEPNETFTVALGSPTNATLSRAIATGTIVNDDSAPLPALSISDATVTEGNSGTTTATFNVALSAASTSAITVNYATADGTATAGTDYVAKTGTLTFAAGTTTNTIAVTVNGDTVVEPNETFSVNLTSPVGATIADAQGVATIANDDTAGTGPQAVTWTSMVGVSANGGTLTKTASNAWGNAGATSTNSLVSGDGYVEFTAAETNTYRLVGLSNGDSNQAYEDIDFAIDAASAGEIRIYEKGVYRGSFATYVSGDKLRVSVQSGVVKYLKNGVVFYVSTSTPVLPVLVDASLYTTGATLANTVVSGSWVASTPPPPSGEAVVWKSMVGVSANAGSLTKTAVAGWGNAGAVSTKSLTSGDGYVEFTASENNTYRLIGLSNGDSNQAYEDIDFAIDAAAGGELRLYEKGVYRGTVGSYATGDRLRIAVQAGVVKYLKNGVVLFNSPVAPVYPLLVDTSLYSTGATLTSTVVSGSWVASTPPPPSGEAVVWKSMVGVSANAGSLTKTAVAGWGNAGAASTKSLTSGDGYVEFTATETNTYRLIGLSNGDSNQAYEDIDFAFDAAAGGQLLLYERGVYRGTVGSYATGDKLRIAVQAGVVKYLKNGVVLFSSPVAPVYPLLVDTSLYSTGATLTNTVVSGSWQ